MFPKKEVFTRAYNVLQQHVHKTPITTSSQIDQMMGNGNKVFFKCENLQRGGAFKARGACHAIEKLSQEEKNRGVVTHSSGNHGIALSMMGKQFGVKVTVILPEYAPLVKRKIIESFGSEMIYTGGTKAEWMVALNQVVEETGATAIPNDNHWDVIVGQGTTGMEMQEQLGETKLDYILVPNGCGSLCAGVLLANSYFYPHCKVIGSEPTLEQDTYLSFKSGKIEPQLQSDSICDGLRVHIGVLNFEVIKQKKLHDLYLVDDKDTVDAMFLIWEKLKMMVEVSSSLPLAALLKNKDKFKNANIGIVLSGGNVDFKALLPQMIQRFH